MKIVEGNSILNTACSRPTIDKVSKESTPRLANDFSLVSSSTGSPISSARRERTRCIISFEVSWLPLAADLLGIITSGLTIGLPVPEIFKIRGSSLFPHFGGKSIFSRALGICWNLKPLHNPTTSSPSKIYTSPATTFGSTNCIFTYTVYSFAVVTSVGAANRISSHPWEIYTFSFESVASLAFITKPERCTRLSIQNGLRKKFPVLGWSSRRTRAVAS